MPAAKRYNGPLAFDSDSGFHVTADGEKVVTPDEGKSWYYAREGDPSHFERYHRRYATVDSTANRFAELAYQHGEAKAEELMRDEQPHHYEVQPDDPHFGGVVILSDEEADVATGHTDAWKED